MSSTAADNFKAEGMKALNRSTIFGFGKTQKYEDAAEAFTKAGNAYKLVDLWQSAGDSFLLAADAHKEAGSETDRVTATIEAANCFKKVDPGAAIQAFQNAIELYKANGRFGMCARYYKEIAEIFEGDNNNDGALESYKLAADFFDKDNKKSNGNQCLLKVATITAEKKNYAEAAEIFENLAKESLQSRLGAYSAKGYFLQALLCLLASGDAVGGGIKMDTFKNLDFSFSSSRECDFIAKLIAAMDAMNDEDFATACSEFDRITPLDPWKTSLLLQAKKSIVSMAEEDVDLR